MQPTKRRASRRAVDFLAVVFKLACYAGFHDVSDGVGAQRRALNLISDICRESP